MRMMAAVMICLPAVAAGGAAGAEASTGAPDRAESIMAELSRMRGHPYREAIRSETLSEGRVRSFLTRKLHEEYSDERLEAERITMVHFGLLDPGDDLEGLFVSMLSDQAAGYYDPETSRMILVKGKPFPGLALVHELAHALQDQVFGIRAILDTARAGDDALLAAQAMIEGEATLLTERFVETRGKDGDFDAEEPARESRGARRREDSPPIPRILQRTFIFPYVEGLAWARKMHAQGGNALMDACFRRPPESTEQILHPAGEGAPRDVPSRIDTAMLEAVSGETAAGRYRHVRSSVMGEFMIREVLGGTDDRAVSAARGWDGDLYAVHAAPDGRTALVWITAWDTAADAAEFREAVSGWLTARRADRASWRAAPAAGSDRVVVVVEGFDPDRIDRIARTLERSAAAGVTFQ